MQQKRTPKYQRQRQPGRPDRAFTVLDGRRVYLGDFGTPDSRAAYHRLIAEWQAGGQRLPVPQAELTIVELIVRFWQHVQTYYVKPDGTPTGEVEAYRAALKPLKELYAGTPAASFGPAALKAVRQRMVDTGWCRGTVNKQVGRLRYLFRWAASEELLPVTVYQSLACVVGLKRGRCTVREAEPIKPVPDAIVNATLEHLTPTVRAMVELQRLTGMRPGEVCTMRACDLNMDGPVWEYRPPQHKTAWRGRERMVPIGPRGQSVLRPFLRRDLQAYLFSPAESEADRLTARHAKRLTPPSCGNRPGTNVVRRRRRAPGDCYNTQSFGKAIAYACGGAFPIPDDLPADQHATWRREHRWAPNRLRHSYATEVRRGFGLEGAQVCLGHAAADVTQIYAERDASLAKAIALKIG